jgi:hypothetical protein
MSANRRLFEEISHKNQNSKNIFFLFGFSRDANFGLMQFMAICSALVSEPTAKLTLFYIYEPIGEYWRKLPSQVDLVRIHNFSFFGIARLKHFAHKADVIRLLLLDQIGGVYLDIDTISMKPLSVLYSDRTVMGTQLIPENGEVRGLCNAVMGSPKQSPFIKIWLRKYRTFKSSGYGITWDEHSVRLPWILAQENPELVKVLPPFDLFQILWFDLKSTIMSDPKDSHWNLQSAPPVIHLWETLCGDELSLITEDYIKGESTYYAKRAKEVCDLLEISL